MRRDWRNVLLALILFLNGATVAIAQSEKANDGGVVVGNRVHLTVEVIWGKPNGGEYGIEQSGRTDEATTDQEFTLELTDGRVVEVMDWPPVSAHTRSAGVSPPITGDSGATPQDGWRLGKRSEGRVRVRLEAALDASLVLRAGDQAVGMPLAAVLERPQHHATTVAARVVSVERLAWDSIHIELGESARDGIVAPGATVPLSVAYNILWPDASEVSVRTSAVLRAIGGGEVLWHDEPREVVAANQVEPTGRAWSLRAPRAEGTYVLEMQASWEPATGREGSRLARLIRRRKPGAVTTSAVRRVVFTVVDPKLSVDAIGPDGPVREAEADSVDLSPFGPCLSARSYREVPGGRARTFFLASTRRGIDRAFQARSSSQLV